jgi:hypothetical protein
MEDAIFMTSIYFEEQRSRCVTYNTSQAGKREEWALGRLLTECLP